MNRIKMSAVPFSRSLILLTVLVCSALGRLSAQTTLLDTVDSPATNFTFTGSMPRTYMGDGFTNSALTPTSQFNVTGLSLFLVSATAASYTDVLLRIQFYNSYNPNAASVFSNPAGPLQTFDVGAQTFAANTIYEFDFTLTSPSPITLFGNNLGFAQNFQSSTLPGGLMPADNPNLTSLITYNTAGTGYAAGQITTGTSPNFGYYRNASGRTDFNFANTDSRSLGVPNQAIGIIVSGSAVPEPSTYAMVLGGLGILLFGMRARRALR